MTGTAEGKDRPARRVMELEREVFELRARLSAAENMYVDPVSRILFENSSDAVFMIESATGRIVRANEAAELLTGRFLKELRDLSVAELFPADTKIPIDHHAATGESVDHGEVDFLSSRGGSRSTLLSSVQLGGGRVLLIARDISDLRRDEVVARDRQEILQAILDHVDSIIVVKDNQGRYLLVNRKTEEITGRKSEDILGKTALEIYPPGIAENIYDDDMQVIDTMKSVTVEEYLRQDDGRVYLTTKVPLFDNNGRIRGMCGLATDITQRKSNEEQLRKSEERFRQMFEEAPLGYQSLDAQGNFVAVNKAFVKLLGYEREELIGKQFVSLVASGYRQNFENKFKILKEQGAINGNVLELIKKDGNKLTVAIDGRVSRDQKGNFRLTHSVLHDLTERQLLEEERSKAARLESIGILAGGIAHDFNNILTAILGNISLARYMAQREGSGNESLLAEAEKSGLRARGLTQQLLTFSKGGEPIRKLFCIKELLQSAVLFALRGSNVICEFDLPEGPCPVEADEGQVNQVFHNIAINADQAMPDGGRLTVKLVAKEVTSADKLPLDNGRYLQISITDEGRGIPRKDLPRIFDPYFTTKSHGSGLGLATCYSIIMKHDGHIGVESRVKAGTTFHIFLVASDETLEQEHGEEKARSQSGRILIMDDELDVCNVASKMLEHLGFEVETAANGSEAVRLYSRASKDKHPFNAVILDLTVPGDMGGRETLLALKSLDSDVKAIVSSGYSNDPVMSEPERYGFQAVIAKPYRIDDLQGAVSEVLG